MQLTRRNFFKLISAGIAMIGVYWIWGWRIGPSETTKKTLPAFLDTLIPRDESPSATDLTVDQKLLQKLNKNKRYQKLVDHGCNWLEEYSQKELQQSFNQLSEEQRISIVSLLAKQKTGTDLRRFFDRIRTDAFQFYYSDAGSWQGLGIDLPPQPLGFEDYDRAPVLDA